jgi:hypothetical protein
VDGLKYNPVTGMVWALQNNDGNATLSLINPTTHAVTGPLMYAVPPYFYGPNGGSGRGYDDVAFLNGKVYLSYTNPVNPTDPVLQVLDQGNSPDPTKSLTTTNILTAQQVNPNFTAPPGPSTPDIDSLKSTPNGELVLTSEGDSPGMGLPPPPASAGVISLIAHPDTPQQTVTNYLVEDEGVNVFGLDDIIFPGAKAGWLYVAATGDGAGGNTVYRLRLTGLDPNAPIAAIGSLNEVAILDLENTPGLFATANVGTALLTGINGVHGMDFVAPEPSTWAMLLFGFAGLGFMGYRASAKRRAALAG